MEPVIGEKLELPAGLPLSIEAALQRFGTSTMKAPAATVLDGQGKIGATLPYGTLNGIKEFIIYLYTLMFGSSGLNSRLFAFRNRQTVVARQEDWLRSTESVREIDFERRRSRGQCDQGELLHKFLFIRLLVIDECDGLLWSRIQLNFLIETNTFSAGRRSGRSRVSEQ